jgi:hypothetical protein
MATITFTYDTGSTPLSKITDAFALAYNYQTTIDGQSNPETKSQFARRMVKQYVVETVRAEDIKAAQAAINISPINLT